MNFRDLNRRFEEVENIREERRERKMEETRKCDECGELFESDILDTGGACDLCVMAHEDEEFDRWYSGCDEEG